jgi:Domain of unknown function (DUF6429)/Protein of unknown function (DUF2442)
MRYETPGNDTSAVEVTNVSTHGLWLLINEQEVFLSYDKFPWFQDAPIGKVVHVELPTAEHLYWPELDVDLEVESILHQERFPLASRVHEAGEGYLPAERTSGLDKDKIDDCVLALLQLTLHDGALAWKGQDFEVMNRLFDKGYILDPRNKTKSVFLTQDGLVRSKELFDEFFGKKEGGGD